MGEAKIKYFGEGGKSRSSNKPELLGRAVQEKRVAG